MSKHLYKYVRSDVFPTPFCSGCGHGILMGAILRAIDELEYDIDEMLFVSGIGCGAWIPSPHFAADTLHVTHGRPIAFATGAKLFKPSLKVVVISGDGDLASIGGNHLIHAARRDTDLTVICANNGIYGMTGGQVAASTPLDARTSTTPDGNRERPFDLCRLVEAAGGTYVARYAVIQIKPLIRSIKRGLEHAGFSFIEVLSPCPTQFGRRNASGSPYEMLQTLRANCVSRRKGEAMETENVEGKILTGEFVAP